MGASRTGRDVGRVGQVGRVDVYISVMGRLSFA